MRTHEGGGTAPRPASMLELSKQYRRWSRAQKPGPSRRVLVLGAGLSGLCAAWELRQLGHDVRVIEARTRPGGRVLTLREPFQNGLYAEAGALFIPEQHELTVAYSRCFDLTLQPLPKSEARFPHYYIGGKLIKDGSRSDVSWPVELDSEEKKAGIVGMNKKFLRAALPKLGDPRAPGWPTPEAKQFDALSFYDYLLQEGASPGAITLLRAGYYDLWGDGVASCSALALIRDTALMLQDPDEFTAMTAWHRSHSKNLETYTVEGGNDLLPAAFADRLGEAITYDAPVEALTQSSSGVSVHCGSSTHTGDFVVCTIPFSVLREIDVSPPFDENKARAVRELPYTSVARIFLETSRRFWDDTGMTGVVATDLPLMWVSEATFGQPGTRGILESYCTGARARGVTAMEPAERVRSTLRLFQQVYPRINEYFDDHSAVKCWDEDPWMKGDYCWFKPGQMSCLLPHIATPADRVHFAGDHTSALPGWMQGAFESALRAVTEVNEAAARL